MLWFVENLGVSHATVRRIEDRTSTVLKQEYQEDHNHVTEFLIQQLLIDNPKIQLHKIQQS